MNHHVIWDGRRNGPGGAHLFAEDQDFALAVPVRQPPRRVIRAVPVIDLVLMALGQAPATLREIANALGVDRTNVNSALFQLKKKGLIEVVGVRLESRGRKGDSIYGVVSERN